MLGFELIKLLLMVDSWDVDYSLINYSQLRFNRVISKAPFSKQAIIMFL